MSLLTLTFSTLTRASFLTWQERKQRQRKSFPFDLVYLGSLHHMHYAKFRRGWVYLYKAPQKKVIQLKRNFFNPTQTYDLFVNMPIVFHTISHFSSFHPCWCNCISTRKMTVYMSYLSNITMQLKCLLSVTHHRKACLGTRRSLNHCIDNICRNSFVSYSEM